MLISLKSSSGLNVTPRSAEMMTYLYHYPSTGVVADHRVNCDLAMEVGLNGVHEIVGNNFHDVKITRKNKVVPLAAMNGTIRVRGEEVLVNPQQLFMRMSCIVKCPSDYKEYISFE